jgi:UDP-N-acetylglucosamine 2-epimerase (non-hydrolysing)
MKILSSASARPNFVKLASIDQAVRAAGLRHVIVHTGQHYDPMLSDVFFQELSITEPAYNLGVKGGGSRDDVIVMTEMAVMPILEQEKPDIVLVYGDVNGSVGVARAAKKLGLRLGHVESGLRSGDLLMPEELNRIEIDQIADELFTTEQSANTHLQIEGVHGHIHFVGNTMIDTLMRLLPVIAATPLSFAPQSYVVATIHRPSNTDDASALRTIFSFLSAIPQNVVLSVHPRTRAAMERHGISASASLHLIDPLGYIEFLALCRSATCIVTDSGGIQEEAVLLGKQCFTLRRSTERPSTIEAGSNQLIDPTRPEEIALLQAFMKVPTPQITIPPLWDGKAGERIVDVIRKKHAAL